ncbi:hypothetical protein [Flavivirga algicola]|uniref:ABC transporter permease n=1 Tax=Flavivirga algicola TaxID=2729136 RepID=A0ABX1S5L0_9FLAO|nr:hypothetical protein [Flavivirga algicola]NMH89719.1 hypothetical protein [Flavivirga algicola]
MNLQKHFHVKRFYTYLKFDLRLNGKTYLFYFTGLIIFLFILAFFTLATASNRVDFNESYYSPLGVFLQSLTCVLVSGTSFPALRSHSKSINYLLLPASIFEKFLVQFIIRILVFVSLFLPLYWLSYKCAYGIYDLFSWENPLKIDSFHLLSPIDWHKDNIDTLVAVSTVIALSVFAFTGAAYFKKYALFKSVFVFMLVALGYFLFMVCLSHLYYYHKPKELFDIKLRSYNMIENIKSSDFFIIIQLIGTTLFLIPMSYFYLKERKV